MCACARNAGVAQSKYINFTRTAHVHAVNDMGALAACTEAAFETHVISVAEARGTTSCCGQGEGCLSVRGRKSLAATTHDEAVILPREQTEEHPQREK